MFLCYAAWIVMIGCSIREFLRENWIGAFYFLLACGFLAIWVELRKNNGTAQVYNNCQWFVNPQMGGGKNGLDGQDGLDGHADTQAVGRERG